MRLGVFIGVEWLEPVGPPVGAAPFERAGLDSSEVVNVLGRGSFALATDVVAVVGVVVGVAVVDAGPGNRSGVCSSCVELAAEAELLEELSLLLPVGGGGGCAGMEELEEVAAVVELVSRGAALPKWANGWLLDPPAPPPPPRLPDGVGGVRTGT